ncbi:hypothetical protein ACWDSL_50545 [Streptomyces sp. NPDC000941]
MPSRRAGSVCHAEELLPFHSHVRHALLPGSSWYRGVIALLLCGLLLAPLDCLGPHKESADPRATAQTTSGSPAAASPGDSDVPEAAHSAESCAPLGLTGLSTPRPPVPSRDLTPIAGVFPAPTRAAVRAAIRPQEERGSRARSGISRLAVVCRWRI